MTSMNNWLGFSLSPQEVRSSDHNHTISSTVADDCFRLPADDSSSVAQEDTLPIQNNTSYSILDSLDRPNNNSSPQDWSMKGTSDLSMLVGSTSGNGMEVDEQPKLEDFLGGTSGGYIFPNYSSACANPNSNPNNGTNVSNNANGSSTIGLSMIKSWLRNQPVPTSMQPQEADSCVNATTGASVSASQGLSLSMSTTETRSPMPLVPASTGGESSSSDNNNKQKGACASVNNNGGIDAQNGAIEAVQRKSIDTFGQRTSIYRGVTRHRWTGRYEAHLWDNSCRREGQTRKGRQGIKLYTSVSFIFYTYNILIVMSLTIIVFLLVCVLANIFVLHLDVSRTAVYLGGYDKEEKAARAYDLAALKYWGTTTTTNFPISNYEKELEEMKHMTRQEYVASLRRKSSGFSRGASIYRGVTRHHQHGRWQARIGRVAGNKDLYLGTFSTQEEAAEAYDIAAIKFRGLNAVTNFDMSRYDVKSILESSTLPIGGAAKRLKDVSEHTETSIDGRRLDDDNITSHLTEAGLPNYGTHHGWPTIAFQQAQPLSMHYYGQSRVWCKQEHDSIIGTAQGLQELQHLQLGSGAHNFFHPSGMHNMIGMDSADHSTGSNTVAYNGGSYMMPMGTMMADHGQSSNHTSSYNGENDGMLAASGYYLTQQSLSGTGGVKDSGYEQGNGRNNWVQSSVQAMAHRSASSVTVCHGAPPLFTVWNDA
ncbi:AP2-like ethylene-responsive transcription factor [Rhynchospora pubera]|uniref:AP2-like ethylene-responsive transcription factor n=1 Tax=Rhynchospora pubera TaxID=906938 RepID=A0AAV8DHS1_9POAL|nr:AP2-like ethylene-responsive transcription factor [Rhynchospora pubera]